jgi:hypothetical protein
MPAHSGLFPGKLLTEMIEGFYRGRYSVVSGIVRALVEPSQDGIKKDAIPKNKANCPGQAGKRRNMAKNKGRNA